MPLKNFIIQDKPSMPHLLSPKCRLRVALSKLITFSTELCLIAKVLPLMPKGDRFPQECSIGENHSNDLLPIATFCGKLKKMAQA